MQWPAFAEGSRSTTSEDRYKYSFTEEPVNLKRAEISYSQTLIAPYNAILSAGPRVASIL
jgi:hypothetical protein